MCVCAGMSVLVYYMLYNSVSGNHLNISRQLTLLSYFIWAEKKHIYEFEVGHFS